VPSAEDIPGDIHARRIINISATEERMTMPDSLFECASFPREQVCIIGLDSGLENPFVIETLVIFAKLMGF
jgi:hypothetical protein